MSNDACNVWAATRRASRTRWCCTETRVLANVSFNERSALNQRTVSASLLGSGVARFIDRDLESHDVWRAIILYGRNVATGCVP